MFSNYCDVAFYVKPSNVKGLGAEKIAVENAVTGAKLAATTTVQKKAVENAVEAGKETTLEEHIQEECSKKGVDVALAKAVIQVESGWNVEAVGDVGNSFGLMQIQPRYHSDRMAQLGVDDLFNPKQNVTVGIDILSELIGKYGIEKGLNAYNSGSPYISNGYAEKVKEVMECVK